MNKQLINPNTVNLTIGPWPMTISTWLIMYFKYVKTFYGNICWGGSLEYRYEVYSVELTVNTTTIVLFCS